MNIAELFVNLGIKGSEKTLSALGGVKKGLGDITSTSLETKAAILAVMYGLEQMTAKSGAAGTGLTNFTAFTGQSAKQLQQWTYAARQAGESSEEFTNNVKSVQSALTKTLMGEAAPKGLAMVARATGGITKEQLKAMAENPFLMLERLQQYALKEKNTGLRNEVLKSFGLSEATISGMARNAFNPGVFAKAPTYSDKELGSLDKSNIAWSNLGQKIEMAFGHFNAKHGQELVGEIDHIAMAVIKLSEALILLADKAKVFGLIGWAAEKATALLQVMGIGVDDALGKHKKGDNAVLGKDSWIRKALDWRDDVDKKGLNFFDQHKTDIGDALLKGQSYSANAIAPPVSAGGAGSVTNINQNITHHGDAKDTHGVKAVHGAAARDYNHAYRQRQQGQGS